MIGRGAANNIIKLYAPMKYEAHLTVKENGQEESNTQNGGKSQFDKDFTTHHRVLQNHISVATYKLFSKK